MGVESPEKVFDKKFVAIENGQTFFHFQTGLSEFEFESGFIDVAEQLLNQSLISIKNKYFRIIELEFYVFAKQSMSSDNNVYFPICKTVNNLLLFRG